MGPVNVVFFKNVYRHLKTCINPDSVLEGCEVLDGCEDTIQSHYTLQEVYFVTSYYVKSLSSEKDFLL